MLSATISNISQPMISQQICPNQVISTKFSETNLVNQRFSTKRYQKQFLHKFFNQNFSTISQQHVLNKIFSTKVSQHFLNIFSIFSQLFLSYKWSCRVGKAERGREEELIIKWMGREGGREKLTWRKAYDWKRGKTEMGQREWEM